ncbi:ABC transporter ATP-binding protein [Rathayibacter sp. SD072]|uniref:ABC transporter ATP-binding protein n=1 Tax=Rathayibacter sp. SD072 TaxID=2781731 RepID=UPI001A971EF4|nr:ABC transporter ATP-binding protein [Rathayibacter sp. SD072]MBO0982655.1 ABC transporter ATP-binding protein [Rathayibacter sp. SD072]
MTASTAPAPPLLELRDFGVDYGSGRASVAALDDIDMTVPRGTTLGIVGESGSGKSTLAKAIVGQIPSARGRLLVDGQEISTSRPAERRALRRRIQLIPQDPYSSLNPRRTIGQAIAEAIDPRGGRVAQHADAITRWLETVRLDPEVADRYPHEFSGGQRQRIAIARALAIEPELIIADEITSALDVSVQAEILTLLDQLRHELNMTMLFISHNLEVVQRVSDTVMVLFHGRVVEYGTVEQVYFRPRSDYTRRLLDSVPGGAGFDIGTATVATA